ncbi:MAG: phosphoribosyltransferase [Opitutae bacterium]|nr:phosphoribosyltransferase [Opitutae bacterium]
MGKEKTRRSVPVLRPKSRPKLLNAADCGALRVLSMQPLAFQDIAARLARWGFPAGLDGVVGIAAGGVVPAALVAQRLGLELRVLALNYRDEANAPRFAEPQLLAPVPDVRGWRRILLVDDVYVSGKSWHAARALLPAEAEVLPFVLKGKVDFALIRDIDGCVRWPWRVYAE